MNKKKKKILLLSALIAVLVVAAGISVSAAVLSSNLKYDVIEPETESVVSVQEQLPQSTDEDVSIPLDDLRPEIERVIKEVSEEVGGEWSVYITVPKSGDYLSINNKKMQAASLIKLCIMGTVYEEYDDIKTYYSNYDVDDLMQDMIVISDNRCADTLVTMLGRGNYVDGMQKVNAFCERNELNDTVMGRLMSMNDDINDNFTTTEDMAKLLQMMQEGKFKHSKDMLSLLEKQDRKLKIPAGVPSNVRTANKTGELADVHNDAAIIYTKYPYIMVVMSEELGDYRIPISYIAEMSRITYEYIDGKEEEAVWTLN